MKLPPEDNPIIPLPDAQPFCAEVIDLAGIRVQWGLEKIGKYHPDACKHTKLVYSSESRRVWCDDCKRTIENFDAFMVLVNGFERMEADARRKMKKADEAMSDTIHRRATKAIDKAWSSSLPAIGCPHCRKGLLPEDFEKGVQSRSSREFEMARRGKQTT